MERNYRLERWIAVILGLLFFLPFVANAEELLFTGHYGAAEVSNESGEPFLALVQTDGVAALVPVSIRIERVFDPFEDEDGERTGKRVTVSGYEDVYLLRGTRLSAGTVTRAEPAGTSLPARAPMTIAFGGAQYTLDYDCGATLDHDGYVDCDLTLSNGTISQTLAIVSTFHEMSEDLSVSLAFAGDLDRDGRLDLLLDTSADEHEWHPTLFLSSAARDGGFVARVAERIVPGC